MRDQLNHLMNRIGVILLVVFLDGSFAINVAVIGSGIGGTSTCHFIKQLFGDDIDKMHIYEKENVIGGRLATVKVAGRLYEAGGSVIHSRNLYMKSFLKTLGLKKRDDGPNERAGIFDGQDFVFEGSDWSLVNKLKLVWHFGFNELRRLSAFVEDMLDKFDRIYTFQDKGRAYATVESILRVMGGSAFVDMLNVNVGTYLRDANYSQTLVNQLVQAAMLVNYGQPCSQTHTFVGGVTLAGAGIGGDLWSVEGGNRLVAEGLFNKSGASLIKCRVGSIGVDLDSGGKYKVGCDGPHKDEDTVYDFVVMAAPLMTNIPSDKRISFTNLGSEVESTVDGLTGRFWQTVATFIQGSPSPFAFHVDAPEIPVDCILVCNSSLPYNSLGQLTPCKTDDDLPVLVGDKSVWKVFSQKPIIDSPTRNFLFKSVFEERDAVMLAYPDYGKPPPIWLQTWFALRILQTGFCFRNSKHGKDQDRLKFDLDEDGTESGRCKSCGLFYLNAIEWAASAMEMSVISARNIALLAYERYYGESDDLTKNILRKKPHWKTEL